MNTSENHRRIQSAVDRARRAADEQRAADLAAVAVRRRRIRDAARRAERLRDGLWLEELLAVAHAEENAERRARNARLAAARAKTRPVTATTPSRPSSIERRAHIDSTLMRIGIADEATRRRAVDALVCAPPGRVVKVGTTHEVTLKDGSVSIHRVRKGAGVEAKAYASAPRAAK